MTDVVTYLSSYFSPNMIMKSARVSFKRISVPEFIAEVRRAEEDGLVNIIQYNDTLELVRKLTGVDIPRKTVNVTLQPSDTLLLVTVKNRKKYRSIWEAMKANRVLFWKVRVEVVGDVPIQSW